MEIKINEEIIRKAKQDYAPSTFHNGEVYKKVTKIYRELVGQYFRLDSKLFVPKESVMNETFKKRKNKLTAKAKKARKTMSRIKRIVEICRKLDVDIESYMKTQFRLIYPDFIKLRPRSIIGLGWLISPLAVERFTQLATGREKRVSMDGTAKIKKKKGIINIERVMLSSIKTIERRLLVVKEEIELNPDIVNEELIRLLRFKKISKVYIYSSDFIREQGVKTLRIKQKLIQQKLNMKQKGEIDGFKYRYNFNQEVEKYVR